MTAGVPPLTCARAVQERGPAAVGALQPGCKAAAGSGGQHRVVQQAGPSVQARPQRQAGAADAAASSPQLWPHALRPRVRSTPHPPTHHHHHERNHSPPGSSGPGRGQSRAGWPGCSRWAPRPGRPAPAAAAPHPLRPAPPGARDARASMRGPTQPSHHPHDPPQKRGTKKDAAAYSRDACVPPPGPCAPARNRRAAGWGPLEAARRLTLSAGLPMPGAAP